MEVTECKTKVKCELGACRNRATKTVKLDRSGRGRIYACDKCLCELHDAIGAVVVPKSVETAKRKRVDIQSDKERK